MDRDAIRWHYSDIRLCEGLMMPFVRRIEYDTAAKVLSVIADVPSHGEARVYLKALRTCFGGMLRDLLFCSDVIRGADEAAVREFAAALDMSGASLEERRVGTKLIFSVKVNGATPHVAVSAKEALTPIE